MTTEFITFFSGAEIPVYLITMFSKGERSDLSQRERNELSSLAKTLVGQYRNKVAVLKRS